MPFIKESIINEDSDGDNDGDTDDDGYYGSMKHEAAQNGFRHHEFYFHNNSDHYFHPRTKAHLHIYHKDHRYNSPETSWKFVDHAGKETSGNTVDHLEKHLDKFFS